jgi:benzylsuccinate CoA-transferase BbsF subunit
MKQIETDIPKQALEGIKVLDFGWALVGALTTKQLADHGAQVVRVESSKRLDGARTTRRVGVDSGKDPDSNPYFSYFNTSKYSIALDLKQPQSRGIIHKLVQWADVINENYSPGTMKRLGLDYAEVCKIKPDIIMTGSSIYGQTGPLAQQGGVDGNGNAVSGRVFLRGWPDRKPILTGVPWGDIVVPVFVASAIIAAIDYKRRTGKGQYIDTSMFEICSQQITPALLDWQTNSHLQTRNGNRIPYAAPHGIFPCKGNDRWCAIAVFSEEEWQSFCQAIGNPAWTRESIFSSLEARKENEDGLEKLVSAWTLTHSAEEVMQILQTSGVASGIVQNPEDVLEHDPQLKQREYTIPLTHPVLGTFGHASPPYKLLKTRALLKTSPCLGEHTEYVCTHILGMSDEEFINLAQQGVFI